MKNAIKNMISVTSEQHGLRRLLVIVAFVAALSAMSAVAVPGAASAATADLPAWSISVVANPTNFSASDPGGTDNYQIMITNSGGAATSSPFTVTDTLPAGLTLDSSGAKGAALGAGTTSGVHVGSSFSCTSSTGASGATQVTCTDSGSLPSGMSGEVQIPVDVSTSAPASVTDIAEISGGGATSSASATVSAEATGGIPSYGTTAFDGQTVNSDGSTDTEAGSHPYSVSESFDLATKYTNTDGPGESVIPVQDAKDVNVNLPAGLVGNPTQTPATCSLSQLGAPAPGTLFLAACPAESQVGVALLGVQFSSPNSGTEIESPIFNVVPAAGEPARLGMLVDDQVVLLDASVRTGGDYGLTIKSSNISQALEVYSGSFTIWGNPADASHDAVRDTYCDLPTASEGICYQNGVSTDVPAETFLTNPSHCSSSALTTTMSTDSWEAPGNDQTASYTQGAMTGCGSVPFTPSLSITPTTTTADSPSGLDVDVSLPDTNAPDGIAEGTLQNATVTLPQGVTVDPSAAAGLTGCSPAQIGMGGGTAPLYETTAPNCPNSSKIGSVTIDTPLLPDPLTGSIYVAQPHDNPFGSLLGIYVTAFGDGVWVKLAGDVQANPVTGQLQTTFSNNPQLPFSDLKLDFFGGSQGILATPQGCGSFTTTSDLSSWAGGPDQTPSDSFTINSGCQSGFAPSFTAGSLNPQAGAYSPFSLSIQRADTDQNLAGLSVKLPLGMLAKLAGVQECSDAALAAISSAAGTGAAEAADPACPAGSQVGTVQAGSGVGPDPFFLSGQVYLTGPYQGAPYGLAVVVPAVAGPYDLGTVVVRQALFIDPETAQVTDVSDPFPTILDGIPLDIQRIDVDLNRPDFTVNPTSCDPMAVTGTLTSTGGLSDSVSSRFQVGGCQDIGFSPKLKIALTGKGKTRSGDHPTLAATLTDPAGQANIKTAKVTLPLSLALDPNNSNNVCPYATAAVVHGGTVGCATKTIVGSATAVTPLLSEPLTGKVYLVQGLRCKTGQISTQGTCPGGQTAIHTLPSLLVPLRGQIALDLRAKASVSGGKLVTTFGSIPDAAVSKFTLKIAGGKKGLLVVTGRGQSICQKSQVGNADLGAQSGVASTKKMTLSTPCGKPASLKVLSRQVSGDKLLLRVKTSQRGKLTVTGTRLKSFSRTMAAGAHQVTVGIDAAKPAAKTAKAKTGKAKPKPANIKVTVQVTPANAKAAVKTFTIKM